MLECTLQLAPTTTLVYHDVPPTDKSVWLLCRHPWQAHQLNQSAAALVGMLKKGMSLQSLLSVLDPAQHLLTLNWIFKGLEQRWLEGKWTLEQQGPLHTIEVIIPVYQNPKGLRQCLLALAAQDIPAHTFRVTIVDDGSTPALDGTTLDMPYACRLLRLEHNIGPGSARNVGVWFPWAHPLGAYSKLTLSPNIVTSVRTIWKNDQPSPSHTLSTLLAFTDSDCKPQSNWLRTLNAQLNTPWLTCVGTPVIGIQQETLLERYEAYCSSLYRGEQPTLVGDQKDRLPYLASCNLALRRTAFTAVNGFCNTERYGEDVDLCWRLRKAGYFVFYWPQGGVTHAHRNRISSFFSQKLSYASSEAWLTQRHPAHFPFYLSPRTQSIALFALLFILILQIKTATPPLSLLIGIPAGLVFGGLASLWLKKHKATRHLTQISAELVPPLLSLQLTCRETIGALGHLCQYFNRHWGALIGLICVSSVGFSIPITLTLCTSIGIGMAAEWQRKRRFSADRFPSLWTFGWGYLIECTAYSIGYWKGKWRCGWRNLKVY